MGGQSEPSASSKKNFIPYKSTKDKHWVIREKFCFFKVSKVGTPLGSGGASANQIRRR